MSLRSFNGCFQKSYHPAKSNAYITAASTTEGKNFGYVFLDCKIKADSNVTKLYFGRTWRAHAKTAFIHCELPRQITPEAWDNSGNPANETTVRYIEYKSTGEGASTSKRVAWSKQLNVKEANEYTIENIFSDNSPVKEESGWFKHPGSQPFQWTETKKQ